MAPPWHTGSSEVSRISKHISSAFSLGLVTDQIEVAEAILWLCSDAASYVKA
jgi:hypothetical protein